VTFRLTDKRGSRFSLPRIRPRQSAADPARTAATDRGPSLCPTSATPWTNGWRDMTSWRTA